MIATRYVPAACALIAVTLVPTFIHSYSDSTVHDGRSTMAVEASIAGYMGSPSGRNARWGQRRFDSHDWIERIYRSPVDEVKLSIIRSYDAKALYHHPELAVSYGPIFVRSEVRRLPMRNDIPVHVLYTTRATMAVYALHYDDTFVEDPIGFQFRTAAELLFSGRKATTLFFLTDENVPAGTDVESLPSLGLLFAAIDRFLASGGAK